MTWLLSLWTNPLVRKIALYVGLAAAAGWAFKVFWLNPHDAKIEQQAKEKVTKDLEARYKVEWEKQQAAIAEAAAKVETDRKQVDARRLELERTRMVAQDTLRQVITAAKTGREIQSAQVSSIPASELDGALRSLSAELGAPK